MLCNEPFNLRPWEVAELTPYQAHNLYLGVERGKQGQVKPKLADPDDE